jgi:hypothetical protein
MNQGKIISRPVHLSSEGWLCPHLMMVFSLCFQGRANRLRPGTKRIYVLFGESGVFVHQTIGKRGHPFVPDFFADQAQVLSGFLRTFLGLPILKVDMTAARVDVVDDYPG